MKSRRSFIKRTGVAGASLPLFNIGVAGASPNEKVNHASFGFWIHHVALGTRIDFLFDSDNFLDRGR